MKTSERVRKIRSDKKRDVKPTVPMELYECIHRISYITAQPVKNISEELCVQGLQNKYVIEHLSHYFKRNFQLSNTLYRGNPELEPNHLPGAIKRRITIRFQQPVHDRLAALAYSLDQTVSSATAQLLHASVKNADIVDSLVSKYVEQQLEPQKRKELKKIIKFINDNNPYEEEISLTAIVNMVMDEVSTSTQSIKESLSNWINDKKSFKN